MAFRKQASASASAWVLETLHSALCTVVAVSAFLSADTAPPRRNVLLSCLQTPTPQPKPRALPQPVLLSCTLQPAEQANTSGSPPLPQPEMQRALGASGQSQPPHPP